LENITVTAQEPKKSGGKITAGDNGVIDYAQLPEAVSIEIDAAFSTQDYRISIPE